MTSQHQPKFLLYTTDIIKRSSRNGYDLRQIYKMAKQCKRDKIDIVGIPYIRGKEWQFKGSFERQDASVEGNKNESEKLCEDKNNGSCQNAGKAGSPNLLKLCREASVKIKGHGK